MAKAGRQVNLVIDPAADTILRIYCPSGCKTTGRFFSRLLYEYHVRQQEQQQHGQPQMEGQSEEVSAI